VHYDYGGRLGWILDAGYLMLDAGFARRSFSEGGMLDAGCVVPKESEARKKGRQALRPPQSKAPQKNSAASALKF